MKIIIKTNQYKETLEALKAIDGSSIEAQHLVYCKETNKVYAFFKNATRGGVKLTDDTGYFELNMLLKLDDLIQFSETVESNFTDITTVELIEKLKGNKYDYHYIRNEMKELVTALGFANLTANEQSIVARYCATDAMTLIGYFMAAFSLSMEEAVSKYKVFRSIDISEAAKALSQRASSPVVMYIAVKYMSEADASAFSDAIRNFITDLKETAHLGLSYGQARDGIMDYIEATGSYVGAGLTSYTFENGFTYEQCRDEFKNYLVYGTKPTEFDVFSTS